MLITGNSEDTNLLLYPAIIMQCKLAGTRGNKEVYMSKDHIGLWLATPEEVLLMIFQEVVSLICILQKLTVPFC